MHIWHNTRGNADEYFICKGNKVLFRIPKWVGRWFEKKDKVIQGEQATCEGCKHLWMNNSGQYECLINVESVCIENDHSMKEDESVD